MKAWFVLAAMLVAPPAVAGPIAISASSISSFSFGAENKFGPLTWRGGLSLTSPDEKFGGLSALSLSDDCQSLLAVSDAGRWFRARLNYDGEILSGIAKAELAPILDSKGKPPRSKVSADAEALASVGNGRYLVGFESRARIGLYDIGGQGLNARFQAYRSPKEIAAGPENKELESLGLAHGNTLAISENNADENGNLRAWMWTAKNTISFSVKRREDFQITDLAVLADGNVLILERSVGGFLPAMSIRRFSTASIAEGATVEPEALFSGSPPYYAIDNMEGLALCQRDGETRVTLLSDNNFFPNLQRTLLLQFAYDP